MKRSVSPSTVNGLRIERVQVVLEFTIRTGSGIEASAEFYSEHLDAVRQALADRNTTAVAIALPDAGPDHDDWRRTLARDLARAHTPKRVNVVGASADKAREAMLTYLADAPGVTGQYLAAHE